MKSYSYQIFIPGGNDTALVFGLEQNIHVRKYINDSIMERFPNIEQVGFLSEDFSQPQLLMAGGEFCGNAARAAAWYYLGGMPGELELRVSGVNDVLRAGVTAENKAWIQMPVCRKLNDVHKLEEGFFIVRMEGITHIVILPQQSDAYLKSKQDLKILGKKILEHYQLLDNLAAGVIFLEEDGNVMKIHPCVYVSGINTMFYETACGSGTIAVGLVMAFINKVSVDISLIQPSKKVIKAVVNCQGTTVKNAYIIGKIETDNVIYRG